MEVHKIMNRNIFIILILLVLIIGISCTGNIVNEERLELIDEAITSITTEELNEMLTYIASDDLGGRLAGDEGCEEAAEFISKEFESYGLTKGMGDSYYQHFNFIGGVEVGEKTDFKMFTGDDTIELVYGEDYTLTGFSNDTTVEGEIAFVGYGIDEEYYDDYQLDVKNKIVVIMSHSPFGEEHETANLWNKLTTAVKKGVAGIIMVNSPKHNDEDIPFPLFYHSWGNLGMPVIHISWDGMTKLLTTQDLDLVSIQEEIDSDQEPHSFTFDDITISLTTELIEIEKETYNVIGYLPGNDPELKDEVIVIGAHYDHIGLGEIGMRDASRKGEIHNGADDNGTGTIALLEIAEAFSLVKNDIRRTIVFIGFSAEEYGLYGSKYYVQNPIFPINDTIFMCNMDMIGYLGDTISSIGTESSEIKQILYYLEDKYPFEVEIYTEAYGGSDHYYFYHSGVPVSFLHTGLTEVYHTPDNDTEYINFDGFTLVTQFTFELVWLVDSLDKKP